MAAVSDWQWGLAAAAILAALVLGGWVQRQRLVHDQEPEDQPSPIEQPSPVDQPDLRVAQLEAQVSALQQELALAQPAAALQDELNDAREEAELILLQLHQVQEELEHYFLLSQDLQQQLDQKDSKTQELQHQLDQKDSLVRELEGQLEQRTAALSASELARTQVLSDVTDQEHRLQAIRLRLVALIRSGERAPNQQDVQLHHLLHRQQVALRRFQNLHRLQSAAPARPQAGAAPQSVAVNDELSFL